MKFKIVSLGCKVNSYECEALINDLTLKGWELTKKDESDVVIINTCTVTQTSDSKSRQMIRSLKRKNQINQRSLEIQRRNLLLQAL
jgi:threonylcarbamoyladenosine tRNA methylthiotransferase MtaB